MRTFLNKIRQSKYYKLGQFVVFGGIACFLIFVEDTATPRFMSELDEKTNHELLDKNRYKLQVGQLGQFADCMKNYKKLKLWRDVGRGDIKDYYLILNNSAEVKLWVVSNEVRAFSISRSEQQFKGYKGNYLVRCNLDLLGAGSKP